MSSCAETMDSVLRAYIDETGDRTNGTNVGNSLIFGMAAILVTPEAELALQEAIRKLRSEFRIPDGVVMSSKKHLKSEKRRRAAANALSAIPELRVIYTYAVKAEITGRYRENQTIFYNWVAMQTYKRLLWAARNWKGSGEKVKTVFGHVKGHDHETTRAYFESQLPLEPKVPFQMNDGVKWASASSYVSSQAADIYASFLGKLLDPKNTEAYHLELFKQIWPQIRKDEFGCPVSLGIRSLPKDALFISSPMNFCGHCGRKS